MTTFKVTTIYLDPNALGSAHFLGKVPHNGQTPLECAREAILNVNLGKEPERKRAATHSFVLATAPFTASVPAAAALDTIPNFKKIEKQISRGSCEAAIKELNAIIPSDNPLPYLLRARAYQRIASKSNTPILAKQGWDDANAVISMGDRVPLDMQKEALMLRGNFNFLFRNFDHAAKDYTVVVHKFEDHNLARSLMKSYFHAGKYDEAFEIDQMFPSTQNERKCFNLAIQILRLDPRQDESKLLAETLSNPDFTLKNYSCVFKALYFLRRGKIDQAKAELVEYEPLKVGDQLSNFPTFLLVQSILDIFEGHSERIPGRYSYVSALGSNLDEVYARIADEVHRLVVVRENGDPVRIGKSIEVINAIQLLQLAKAPEILFCLADFHQSMDLPFKAIDYCKQALAMDPGHYYSHCMLTEIYYEMGMFEEALPHCEQVCREYELDSPFNIYLYAIHMALNDRDKIAEAHKEIASMSKDVARALLTNFQHLFRYGDVGQMVELIPQFKHIQTALNLVKAQA